MRVTTGSRFLGHIYILTGNSPGVEIRLWRRILEVAALQPRGEPINLIAPPAHVALQRADLHLQLCVALLAEGYAG